MKAGWVPLSLIVVFVGGFLAVRSCQREGWEAALTGPYRGSSFVGDITNTPVSTLPVPSRGRLEVYELPSRTAPVLVLRSEAGDIQWSRLLAPERRGRDGEIERAAVRQFRLHRLERDGAGYEVFVTCDWEWGGHEGGLIDLDSDYGFKSFRLSW